MSETVTEDDWTGVWYDGKHGEFVTISVDNGNSDTVTLEYYGTDIRTELEIPDFLDLTDNLYPVPVDVVDNPEEVIHDVLSRVNQSREGSIELQFAMEFTRIESTVD